MSKPDDWSAETRRTLRFWGVAEGVHGGLLAAAVLGFLPWKTVWINLALVAYAGLHLAAGVGLFLRKRWGWRLGIIAGLLGLPEQDYPQFQRWSISLLSWLMNPERGLAAKGGPLEPKGQDI